MKTLICPYCGCSLVRLGISKEKAATYSFAGTEYHFCCQDCADEFAPDPEQHLQRTKDLVVCPTCLATADVLRRPLRAVRLEDRFAAEFGVLSS